MCQGRNRKKKERTGASQVERSKNRIRAEKGRAKQRPDWEATVVVPIQTGTKPMEYMAQLEVILPQKNGKFTTMNGRFQNIKNQTG